jgi:hypothetical protein
MCLKNFKLVSYHFKIFILIGVLLLGSCTIIKTSDYLKLKDNNRTHFKGVFKINKNDANYKNVEVILGGKNPKDSSFLVEKFSGIKKNNNGIEEDYYLLNKFILTNNIKVFYQINEAYKKSPNPFIGTNNFFQSVFLFKNDSIYFLPTNYKNEINDLNINKFKFYFPKILHKKDTVSYYTSKIYNKLTGFRLEDIEINNKRLKKCLYIKQIQTYGQFPDTSISEAWFNKKYGLVKWIRSTGRVETQIF